MTREQIEAEIADLKAKNDAAPGWGAAVGARSERIGGLEQALRAIAPDQSSAESESADPLCKRIGMVDCAACGAAPTEKCIKNGPTEKYPNRRYCKDDQSCCEFCCGN